MWLPTGTGEFLPAITSRLLPLHRAARTQRLPAHRAKHHLGEILDGLAEIAFNKSDGHHEEEFSAYCFQFSVRVDSNTD